jgi:hypothetical protein
LIRPIPFDRQMFARHAEFDQRAAVKAIFSLEEIATWGG